MVKKRKTIKKKLCVTPECNGDRFWGKYCKKCYKEEFDRNKKQFGAFASK